MENNKRYFPMWSQFVGFKHRWIGGSLQEFEDEHVKSTCGPTEIVDIIMEKNGDSAFFSIIGKDYTCGFDVKHGGISGEQDRKENGWLMFSGYGGHRFGIQLPRRRCTGECPLCTWDLGFKRCFIHGIISWNREWCKDVDDSNVEEITCPGCGSESYEYDHYKAMYRCDDCDTIEFVQLHPDDDELEEMLKGEDVKHHMNIHGRLEKLQDLLSGHVEM